MKFASKILALLLCGGMLCAAVGCKTTPTMPAGTGAVDIVDYDANLILQPAHAFALTMSSAVLSTDPSVHIELTAAQKNVLVTLNKSLNVADAFEQAYHAAPSVVLAAQLSAASKTVQQNLASAQGVITVPPYLQPTK